MHSTLKCYCYRSSTSNLQSTWNPLYLRSQYGGFLPWNFSCPFYCLVGHQRRSSTHHSRGICSHTFGCSLQPDWGLQSPACPCKGQALQWVRTSFQSRAGPRTVGLGMLHTTGLGMRSTSVHSKIFNFLRNYVLSRTKFHVEYLRLPLAPMFWILPCCYVTPLTEVTDML